MKVLLALLLALPVLAQDNLLPNGGFERAAANGLPEGWSIERHKQAQGQAVLDTAERVEGRSSVRVDHTDASPDWVRISVTDLTAAPRTLYRLDLQLKTTAPAQVVLYEYQEGSAQPGYLSHNVQKIVADGQWHSYGLAVTTTAQARSFKVSLITAGQGSAWFDDVKLIRVGATPDADVPTTATPPVIDGRLDEPAWRDAPRCGPFYKLGAPGDRPTAATWVRLLWDQTNLYVAYECEEPKVAAIKADVADNGGMVYQDDSVEAFLDPDNAGTGFAQLAVNTRGARFESRRLGEKYNTTWYATRGDVAAAWHPEWRAAAKVGAAGWTAELALPFASLGGTPQPGDMWAANFARERYAEPELSTWAPLAGETFLQPQGFGRLVFRGGTPRPPELVTRAANQAARPLPVIPEPQQYMRVMGFAELPAKLAIQPLDTASTAYLAVARLLGDVPVRPVGPAGDAPIVVQVDPTLKLPAEGYLLTTSQHQVKLAGADAMGVRNGLMTLAQWMERTADGWRVPAGGIKDWPDTPLRAFHIQSPKADEGPVFREWIETLAKLKYNTLMLEVNDALKYTSHPEVAAGDAPTKAQLKAWVDNAKALGFQVIPQVQSYGHFNWVLGKAGWGNLAENPTGSEEFGPWNANIRDPRYYPLLFDLFQEVIDVFQPTIFHIGHDEITFRPIGVHPATKGTTPADLLTEEVTKLHAWLTGKGLKVMMWGDQLLAEQHGGPPANTWTAVDKLPRDIIIADWHYPAAEQYPSLAFFKGKGYPVVACGWWEPLNVINFSNGAVDQKLMGYAGTSWWGLDNFRNSAELQTAFVLTAENTWSNRKPTIDALRYEPADAWRRLAGWDAPPAERRFALVDLSRQANQRLSDNRQRTGWLGLGPEYDLSQVPRGVQWWGGVPYRILDGEREAILLAAAGDPARSWPVAVKAIPVGTKARALYLCATTSVPARRYGGIYDRSKYYPRRVGKLVVRYTDGTTEEVPLAYRYNLTDWNGGLPPAWAPTVWRGQTPGGAAAQLSGWRWTNPRPDQAIESLDFKSDETPLRIAILAVTAAIE